MAKQLVIIPAYNESRTLVPVLRALRSSYCGDILVVDDGSTDDTRAVLRLADLPRVEIVAHPENRGYGAALLSGFSYAVKHEYDHIVTMDCDWQHEPGFVSAFFCALENSEVASGSRYLSGVSVQGKTPDTRRAVNETITEEINELFGLGISDAFCGFKGYRASVLSQLCLTEPGYAAPLQMWVQLAVKNISICEIAVPRIYVDQNRSFGPILDDPKVRLQHYRDVLYQEVERWTEQPWC